MPQQVPYNVKAEQKDKFPEVVMKMPKDDKIVAKIPNGEILTVLEVDGDGPNCQGRVRWKETEGWVKMCNVIAAEPQLATGPPPHMAGYPQRSQQQVPYNVKAEQKEKFPEVVMKMPKDDKVVAKIPNGEILTVLEVDGGGPNSQGRVRWKQTEGWVKMCNVIPAEPVDNQQRSGHAVVRVRGASDAGSAACLPDDTATWMWGDSKLAIFGDAGIHWSHLGSPVNIMKTLEELESESGERPVRVKTYRKGCLIEDKVHKARAEAIAALQTQVAMKKSGGGQVLASIPNCDIVNVLQAVGEDTLVRWKHTEGLVKTSNLQGMDVFVCGQITTALRQKLTDLNTKSLKSSMPKFNKPKDGVYPVGMQNYDIPCYGPALTQAVYDLLNTDTVKKQAQSMRFMLPERNINEKIQNKMQERGPKLIEEIKRAGGDEAAIKNLEKFVKKVAVLKPKDFVVNGKPRSDGKCWHEGTVNEKWQHNLHVDTILSNFGFSDAFCRSFKSRNFGTESWSDYAVRWLSKAFDVFSFAGSLSDVVNLIYAMLGKPDGKHHIDEVVKSVKEFTSIVDRQEFHKLVWKPNYLIHDSELDDMLVWLLLCAIHPATGPTLVCDVQLPTQETEEKAVAEAERKTAREQLVPGQIAYLESQYLSRNTEEHRVTVFRDPQSRNVDNVQVSACYVPPKTVYLVSATEMRSFCGKYQWTPDKNMFMCEQIFGKSCFYLHPVTGYWVISLDEKAMDKDYYQIQAMKKGCIPNSQLGWKMLVRPENNPKNPPLKRLEQPLQWEEENKVGIQATWLELNKDGEPIMVDGTVKPLLPDQKPVFSFHITTDPTERPESPPLCKRCKTVAEFDGFTHCETHKRQLPEKHRKRALECPVYQKAKKFLDELGVEQWIDHQQDHCWCEACNPTLNEINPNGPYVAPKGWVAFGVVIGRHLREAGVEFHDVTKWPNTFHGTCAENLSKVLRHGQIGMPGDRLIDGDVLVSKNCAGRQDFGKFYTSPTVAYSGLQLYSRPRKSLKDPNLVGQVVLQCNQKKAGYTKHDDVEVYIDSANKWELGKINHIAEDGTVRVQYGANQSKDIPGNQCNENTIRKAWRFFIVHEDGVPVTADHTLGSREVGKLSKGSVVKVFAQHCSFENGQVRNKIVEPVGWITTKISNQGQDEIAWAVKDINDPIYFEQQETMGFQRCNFPNHGVCKYIPLYKNPPCHCENCKKMQDSMRAKNIVGSPDSIEIVSGMPQHCVIRRVLVRTFQPDKPPAITSLQQNRQLKPLPCGNQYETFRSPVDLQKEDFVGKKPGESLWL